MKGKERLYVMPFLIIMAILLGVILFFIKRQESWTAYNGKNISFSYPRKWDIKSCSGGPAIKNAGIIDGSFKKKREPLTIKAQIGEVCENGKLTVKIYHSKDPQSPPDCATYNHGELLKNGLYFQIVETPYSKSATGIRIYQDRCMTAHGENIADFSFVDADDSVTGENILKYGGEPHVEKDLFMASQQYKDIKKFAESIRLKQ